MIEDRTKKHIERESSLNPDNPNRKKIEEAKALLNSGNISGRTDEEKPYLLSTEIMLRQIEAKHDPNVERAARKFRLGGANLHSSS